MRRALARAAGLAAVLAAARAGAAGAGEACLAERPLDGLGTPNPFPARDAEAAAQNAAGTKLYRDGKWEEARTAYRAATAIDPDFLAPRLNIACSFVRQERFREATAEVLALVDRAYVPWAREVLDATDLGALKVRPEMAEVRAAMAAAAGRWGADLDRSLLYVARSRAPLKIPPSGAGVFILNPGQEVWAFVPRTGRYRQITAEDGHVLLLARSPDGRRIAYVTAEKLVRGTRDGDLALRGVALHELTLASMSGPAAARVDGDVRRLEIAARARGFLFRIDGDTRSGLHELAPSGALVPVPERARGGPALAVLTGAGVDDTKAPPPVTVRAGDGCALVARDAREAGKPTVMIGGADRRSKPVAVKSYDGAALAGLPIR
jgi:hypothetical protein